MEAIKRVNIQKKADSQPRGRFPAVLVVIDGFGYAPPGPGNAITLARTPVLKKLMNMNPWTLLGASGEDVGLPPGQEGNSEAGHMNLAAGRVVEQDQIFISRRINDGLFFKNPAFIGAYRHIQKRDGDIHIMGLLSNGQSAHSNPDHLLALLAFFRKKKVKHVYLHIFTDGRDSPPNSGLDMVAKLESVLRPNEKIATVIGRFWAMDRKKNWSRTDQAYQAIVDGHGGKAKSATEAIQAAYDRGETDEFIAPTVIISNKKPVATVKHSDALIYFNLRSDRARQLTKAFVQKKFAFFKRSKNLSKLFFVAMTDFGPDLENVVTAFPSPNLTGTLPMALHGHSQVYIAESEKFAHVTYFLNGGYADPVAGEDRIMIPSPEVDSYDVCPAMSARELTDVVVKNLETKKYDFIGMNYANPDMVAHSGNLGATIQAVEAVDTCLGRVVDALQKLNGTIFIVGDHGNAEGLINSKTGGKDTEHSTCPVPFIIGEPFTKPGKLIKNGILGQVAPTILDTIGVSIPTEMTLPSLWQ